MSVVQIDQSTKNRRSPSLSSATTMMMMMADTHSSNGMVINSNQDERIYVTGLEGSRSVLPCDVTRPHNDTIDLILWFRGADEKALYSIDARRASTMQRAKHFSGDEIGARAYIDTTTRPNGLIIESVKAEDAGEYKCRIDFRKSRSEYRSVQLNVYVPPKEVIIMDEFGQRLNDPVGPFNEGSHLNLICEAEGGNPRPILHWYKNNRLIDDTWSVTSLGIVRNELLIGRLERYDQGAILTCQVLLNISTPKIPTLESVSNVAVPVDKQSTLHVLKSVFSQITLELNLRPLDVRIITVHRPVVAGRSVTINCESNGSKPPALLSWWKGSRRLEGAIEEVSSDENRTISTLQFVPDTDDNGRVLSCRADHSVLPDSALEDSWILRVLFAPKLTISFGAAIQHDQIREGSNVSFECHVAANPSVSEIGWMFENRRLTVDNSDHFGGKVQIKENTLMIFNVNRRHSGRYRCVTGNAQGEGQSDDILLKVQYVPVCKTEQRTLFGVGKREPIQVPCTVDSNPPEVTFRWMFNNSYDVWKMTNFTQPNAPNVVTSVVTYAPLNKYGYGQLLCWASNVLGEQPEPCVFNVIPAGQPQPLRNCVLRNQSNDGLVVYCDPGDDGGLDQQFFLEVFQAEQGQLWANLSLTETPVEFVVTNVPVATTFVLVLYASNAKGRSNYVTLSASTMPPGGRGSEFLKFTADFGIKPVIYILIAVVCSLVVAACAIMIVSRVRTITKSKGRHEPLPSSQSINKINTNSNNGSQANELDKLAVDSSALSMYDMGPIAGPSGLGACPDLFENQEIMTNSSSLYDDSSNIPMNPIYGKTYNPSLLGDGTTATPTSPSTHSSQMANVFIKNSLMPMESTTSSLESGPPPLYHSVYNNFATWNHGKASIDQQLRQMPQSDDLLLMDVSYYGAANSPNHTLLSMSSPNATWMGTSNTMSVPFHHAQQFNSNGIGSGEVLVSSNTVLVASPHVSTNSHATGGAVPYLNGSVSLVDSNSTHSTGLIYTGTIDKDGETIRMKAENGEPSNVNENNQFNGMVIYDVR
ncbi:hypothetical protein BLOT_007237 [Blomia tropicalis]|nr:hypothetical protein BLOT_007237 [Blomia tropicalis]